jgi:pimeloyl-ACP methyl ester carboxylesterase
MKKLLALLVWSIGFSIGAQELPRKAQLGILMQPVSDSLATSQGMSTATGLYISRVMPNSTASKIGLQSGDIMTTFNGTTLESNGDLLEVLATVYAGDPITIEAQTQGKTKQLRGKALGRPQETSEKADITYGTVSYPGNKLRSILYVPKGKKQLPVIYFIQGYTCASIDYAGMPQNPVSRMIDHWVDQGFAVYRVEKPGAGDSQSEIPCSRIDFDQEYRGFSEGYKALAKSPGIDSNKIYIFGHSMGGVIAPLMAQDFDLAGIITYGTIGTDWYPYMVDMFTIQPKLFGVSAAQIAQDNKRGLPFLEDFLVKRLPPETILANPEHNTFLAAQAEAFGRGNYIGRSVAFWQNLAQKPIEAAWQKINCPVLALHGEFDIQAINSKGAQGIAQMANTQKAGSGTFKLIAKADHGFVSFNSFEENVNTLNSGGYMEHAQTHYNPQIAEETAKWIWKNN